MKKLSVLTIALIMSLGVSLSAHPPGRDGQTPPSPEKRAEMMASKLTEALGLTESQKQQVYELNLEMGRHHEAAKANEARSREDIRHDFEKQMETNRQKMEQILTPEQYAKWSEMKPGEPRKGDPKKGKDRSKAKKKGKNKKSEEATCQCGHH